jgi:hypothetical protein
MELLRNQALGFARRTIKNLQCIEQTFTDRKDGHVVTQLMNSMLGLIVFPWEQKFEDEIKNLMLTDLVAQGWPQFQMEGSKCKTLGDLLRHLRNAIAHREIKFDSDSRNIYDVSIHLENHWKDKNTKEVKITWCADIKATELRAFCFKLFEHLEKANG